MKSAMPQNAMQRLQKIENDLKTVISIYEVSNKCKNIQYKSETQESVPQLSQISTQEVLESTTLSDEVREFQTSQFNFLSSTSSCIVQTSPDNYLIQGTSPIPTVSIKNESSLPNPKENAQNNIKKLRDKTNINEKDYPDINDEKKKLKQSEKFSSTAKHENFENSNVIRKKNKIVEKEKKHSQASNAKEKQKAIEIIPENGELQGIEITKIIEKNNEKLEKMKVFKELALDIAKHLKEKYCQIQQSKQALMEILLKVQKENEKLRNDLNKAQLDIANLKESATKQDEEDGKTKQILEQNVRKLKVRIGELEKELLERQRDIDKIQKIRLEEIRSELKNQEDQARDIQRLSKEKCELLARNDQLGILLNDFHLEKQLLGQKIRHLEEEVRSQKEHIEKKTKVLEETNIELETIRQSSSDLEDQVKILRKNNENFELTQKNLIKRIEEYEQQAISNKEEVNKLQEENLTLKTKIENEKDALLIKTKIIEDQQQTIKRLKENSEEAKSLLKKKESLERILNTEREEKLQLEEAVGRLKWRKEELKEKIKVLENDLLLAPQKVARDLQKTQTILFELENQVYSKQKEWELQFHSLIREKEKACSVAEYATKKLIQTSSEYQKQSEAHKRLRRILAEKIKI